MYAIKYKCCQKKRTKKPGSGVNGTTIAGEATTEAVKGDETTAAAGEEKTSAAGCKFVLL